jgi:hypothetical protein
MLKLIFCINCGFDLKKSPPLTASDPKDHGAPVQNVDEIDAIPLGTYILADSAVLGIGGLIISLVTGWFFIGFSLKPRDWPGMIVFVLSTLIGSGIISGL